MTLLAQDIDPSAQKQAAKKELKAQEAKDEATFEKVARDWFDHHRRRITQGYGEDIIQRLEQNVFPWIGHLPIGQVKADIIRETVKRIAARGAVETARRQLQKIGQIMRYAVVEGLVEYDPTTNLRGLIKPLPVQHHKCVTTPADLGKLLRAIDAYSGTFPVVCALKLAPMLFVRPGELRKMEWTEVDLMAAEWRIPAEKMKMKEPHIVPLAPQAVAILSELKPLTGDGQYVFPGRNGRPMSENALRVALIAMGFELSAHGFRGTASTMLNECGRFRHDVIERQLAHAQRNKVVAAYNHAQYLPERKAMMTWWADYLDALKEQGKVVTLPVVGGK
ncbi:MAG: integrase [Clostridia bacterium]|nr:integrase [Clostridia bacterium]